MTPFWTLSAWKVPRCPRHARTGDWGNGLLDDARENELSVRVGFRIMSSYWLASGVTVWIITEADRSATTLLLPEDY